MKDTNSILALHNEPDEEDNGDQTATREKRESASPNLAVYLAR